MGESSSRIRIALVITELQVGGAERCCVQLATGLGRDKYDPVVYSLLAAPPEDRASLVHELQASGIPVHFLGARSWLSLPRTILSLRRHFLRQRPDLVQGFLFHANLVAALAAWLANVPCMMSGIRVAEPRGWHLRLARWADRFVTNHVCVSQAVAEYSRTAGRLPSQKIVVIPNGVDLRKFSDSTPIDLQELGVPAGRRAITFVGRLDAQKGVGWLMHLASRIFAQCKLHDLLVVGQGPDRELLEQIVRELRIGPRVRFAGWQADVPAILAASDVLVLPSQWEGMPHVVLEAMAAGKPIVACDVEGVRELLGEGAEKQIAPRGDAEAFLNRLSSILDDADLAAKLGTQNHRRVADQFAIATMVARYDLLYRSQRT